MTKEKISNSLELWRAISKKAKFQDAGYDKDLLEHLKEQLGISSKNIEDEIASISIEQLFEALFSALQPFSLMMSELLHLFEKIGAQSADDNLTIQLDSDKISQQLQFDINSFRQYVRVGESVKRTAIREYSIDDPFAILRLFSNNHMYENTAFLPEYQSIRNWVSGYDRQSRPKTFPSQPLSGFASLDEAISIIWEFLRKHHIRLWSGERSPDDVLQTFQNTDANRQRDSILWAENDFFIRETVKAIITQLNEIKQQNTDIAREMADELCKKVSQFLSSLDIQYHTVEQKVALFEELFNLPTWKQRYQLYSAWVFTMIVKAFDNHKLAYHIHDGVFSFAYHDSIMPLATCQDTEPPLEIYAELRTPKIVDQLKSEKRKNNIQPDYSIVFQPKACCSVVEIECKQYKKSNVRNFSDAVIDYANNRPGAHIFLVNYGNIGSGVDKAIQQAKITNPYALFGGVKPQTAEREQFVKSLTEIIDTYSKVKIFNQNMIPCKVELSWGDFPSDLDLYMYLRNEEQSSMICYMNRGSNAEFPYCQLDHDNISGNGCETITIFKRSEGDYEVYVHQYSKDNAITTPIKVRVCMGAVECNISRIEPIPVRKYWYAFKICGNKLYVVDKIVDEIEK